MQFRFKWAALNSPYIEVSVLEIVILIGILHCFALGFTILFSKFFKSKSNNPLGYTLLIIAVVGLNNWFWDIGTNPLLINIFDLFLWQFLYPVTLFFFFVRNSVQKSKTLKSYRYFYLPFALLSILNIMVSLSINYDLFKLPFKTIDGYSFFYKSISLLSVIFPLLMVYLSYKQIRFTDRPAQKKWLFYLWVFTSALLVFGVVLESYRFLFSEKLPLTYLWTFASIFIYWLIYHGLFQFKLSNDQFEIRSIRRKEIAVSANKPAAKRSHFDSLINLLDTEKIHFDPNLSREKVADKLGISSGYLSQIVNENAGVNFPDFINSRRVEEVKKLINDPEFNRYSLLAIGLECGFNSKTSFYTNFKKETGLTPREFKNK